MFQQAPVLEVKSDYLWLPLLTLMFILNWPVPLYDAPLMQWSALLTHWRWDKMAAVFQTTFSNEFSRMKMFEFWSKFHWSLFLINKITALVQIMAWRRPGDKPLSEPVMVSLPTHICVARPQWVNSVQYKAMMHASLQWPSQNINQGFRSQKDTP